MTTPATDTPSVAARDSRPEDAWLESAIAEALPGLIALRRHIHAHPEVAWQEHGTTDAVLRSLTEAGVPAARLSVGTGLTAQIGSGGPVVALRADMDALPIAEDPAVAFSSTVDGVSHACGHDMHTTVLVGAAHVLAVAPDIPGSVRLLFQPAEEAMPGGADTMVASGALDGVSQVFALHCDPGLEAGTVGTRVGAITSACDMFTVTVRGPGGHTSRPHLTVDVIGALASIATQLPVQVARHLPSQAQPTLVWGAIRSGDVANVIPRSGTLTGTLRLAEREAWRGAAALVRDLVEQIAAPFGGSVEVDYLPGVPPVVNDDAAVSVLREAVVVGLGEQSLVEVQQSMGGEDFGVMTDRVPGALARLGVWDGEGDHVDLHSATFRADERAIAVGVRTMVLTALTALRHLH